LLEERHIGFQLVPGGNITVH